MNETIKGFNIHTGYQWKLTITGEGWDANFYVESDNLNKRYDDPYLAMKEMRDAGLLTDGEYEEAVFALMRDYATDVNGKLKVGSVPIDEVVPKVNTKRTVHILLCLIYFALKVPLPTVKFVKVGV